MTLRAWTFLLGGGLVWAAHFGGVYAIASLADVLAGDSAAPAARGATLLWTLACLLANGWLIVAAGRDLRGRQDEATRWISSIGAAHAALSAVAVLWQGLPALVVG